MKSALWIVAAFLISGCIDNAPGSDAPRADMGVADASEVRDDGTDIAVDMTNPPPDMNSADISLEDAAPALFEVTGPNAFLGTGVVFDLGATVDGASCEGVFTSDPEGLESIESQYVFNVPGRYAIRVACGDNVEVLQTTVLPVGSDAKDDVLLWLNASDGVIAESGVVTRWRDRGPIGNDVTALASAKNPSLVAFANDTMAVRFESNQALTTTKLLQFEEGRIFLVLDSAYDGGQTQLAQRWWLSKKDDPGWLYMHLGDQTAAMAYRDSAGAQTISANFSFDGQPFRDAHLEVLTLDSMTFRFAATTVNGSTSTGFSGGTPPSYEFDLVGTTVHNYELGMIAEILIVKGPPSGTAIPVDYLRAKYDLGPL